MLFAGGGKLHGMNGVGDPASRADLAELKTEILKIAIGIALATVAPSSTLTFAIVRIAVP